MQKLGKGASSEEEGRVREPMPRQHADTLAEQDGRGARGAEVRKQHTKNRIRSESHGRASRAGPTVPAEPAALARRAHAHADNWNS